MRWGTIIPLIGGSAIGCHQSSGELPIFHLSYKAFSKNEKHLEEYWPDVPMYRLDEEDIEVPSFNNIDYVNSTCPCAGLSTLNSARGTKNAHGSDATQNQWMYKSSEYVLNEIQPKVLWGENAPGLYTNMGEGVVNRLRDIGEEAGYSLSLYKTNTYLHGIPQKRLRTFYFFWKSKTVPLINWIEKPNKPLFEYLDEVPKNSTLQDMFLFEGKVTDAFKPYEFILEKEGLSHSEFVKKIKRGTVSRYLDKQGWVDECIRWLYDKYPDEKFGNKKFIDILKHQKDKLDQDKNYWDLSPHFFYDKYSALVGRNLLNGVHPIENRYLNIREMLHLMGMPHDFEITSKSKFNHIAQNVPVGTAKDLANEVNKFCLGEA